MSVASNVMDTGRSHLRPRIVHDYGDRALLLEFSGTAEVLAWNDALHAAGLPGVCDIVVASRTVLVKLMGARYQAPTRQRIMALRVAPQVVPAPPPADRVEVTIDVVYDGIDLHEVAEFTGLTPAQVIEAHTGTPWRVGFGGFVPGFAYLIGGDHRLRVPRHSDPRTKVPAGTVALGGEFSGIYPRQCPGGWQLIGHTDAVLFDVQRDNPALLTPGMWVQFRAIG